MYSTYFSLRSRDLGTHWSITVTCSQALDCYVGGGVQEALMDLSPFRTMQEIISKLSELWSERPSCL